MVIRSWLVRALVSRVIEAGMTHALTGTGSALDVGDNAVDSRSTGGEHPC